MSKKIENQPRLKKLNLKSNLTCNIYNGLYLRYRVQFWALLIQSKLRPSENFEGTHEP